MPLRHDFAGAASRLYRWQPEALMQGRDDEQGSSRVERRQISLRHPGNEYRLPRSQAGVGQKPREFDLCDLAHDDRPEAGVDADAELEKQRAHHDVRR